jgi:predicted CXXCH cytochrome family protein
VRQPIVNFGLAVKCVLCITLMSVACGCGTAPDQSSSASQSPDTVSNHAAPPGPSREGRIFIASDRTDDPKIVVWWNGIPEEIQNAAFLTEGVSNIRPSDYAGPDACKKCHLQNYETWSKHPHHWMNTRASKATVKGDFSGNSEIAYQGGKGSFYLEGAEYRMRVQRGDIDRVYQVTQTIGSRFYQYYVGLQIQGPERHDHMFYREDHVLPFGYWIDRKEWIPIVHVGNETRDSERNNPYTPSEDFGVYASYARNCNYCHTTFPLGDMVIRNTSLLGKHIPHRAHFDLSGYLQESRPEVLLSGTDIPNYADSDLDEVFLSIQRFDASDHAATLGISCEACHLGCKEHAAGKQKKPAFFPQSKHLQIHTTPGNPLALDRNPTNVNWACGRCHAGSRPTYAAGMSTWNSVESTDAMLGSCYSQLTCIECHNPHVATGPVWTSTPDQDDAKCLSCHQEQFKTAKARLDHTHHPTGSSGDHCMNCHMPRVNEGLQDVVRTHMIYSPTRADMIEANHPNACNQCHVKESIQWTVDYLQEWYGKEYNLDNYLSLEESAAIGWLQSENESVRLIGSDSLTRAGAEWALPQLIQMLDDAHMMNRQFTQIGLEAMLDMELRTFGYHHYMTKPERLAPLNKIRKAWLLKKQSVK